MKERNNCRNGSSASCNGNLTQIIQKDQEESKKWVATKIDFSETNHALPLCFIYASRQKILSVD